MKTDNKDIRDIHRECLAFLLDYQVKVQNFYFVPRKNNNKNRLAEGMYFRGNEDYLTLSFWNASDSNEYIYNISFSISVGGHAYIELSCRDDDTRLGHIVAIKELLEANGKDFEKKKTAKWRCDYPSDIPYLDALEEFILNEKPIVDNYVLAHPECGMPIADKALDDKFVKTLPNYKEFKEVVLKTKKTGAVVVKASEHIMRFQHNQLSNELVTYLKNNGYNSVVTDEDFVDIKAVDSGGKQVFFELKTATKVRIAIRQALGQLLEYNHYYDCGNADKLIIVTESEASEQDVQYLAKLRESYKIPVYYQQFDMKKKVLLAEY